jgi:hypothetical protein
MPPIRSERSQKLIEQGRIESAIQAFNNKEIASIREAARRFSIPYSSLRRRLSGVQSRANSRANFYKLTETEQESLQK